ncbi:hypothetical protein ACFY19_19995 [Streptosporangium saharense]
MPPGAALPLTGLYGTRRRTGYASAAVQQVREYGAHRATPYRL